MKNNNSGEIQIKKVISCDQLSFSYNGFPALKKLNFSVREGEIFALLGPNGAGKTTTIRVLNGLLSPDEGKCRVLGYDPVLHGSLIRQHGGVLTETPALYERLSAWQNLKFFGTLAGLSYAQINDRGRYYLDMFALSDRAQERVEVLSKGMKQRLALARALLHDPELLFLDEPTSGMDPAAAKQVGELIYSVSKQEKRTVILCTHRLFEAEKICDRVAVMKKGTILACGSLEELRKQFAPGIKVHFRFTRRPDSTAWDSVAKIPGVVEIRQEQSQKWQASLTSEDEVPEMINCLISNGAGILSVVPWKATLEEIYLKIQKIKSEEQE